MFRKPNDVVERTRAKIQNKEIKKLKAEIVKQFQLTDEQIGELINKKNSVTQLKLASRTIVYLVNDIPLFYDKEGRNDFYPAIFLLWKYPYAIRNVIIHSPVSEFILNGADLMLPGLAIRNNLEGMLKNEKVCIRVLGNPLPFAVGDSAVSWETLVTYGLKGKGVAVMHIYGDLLCSLAGKVAPPNLGYTPGRINVLPDYADSFAESCSNVSVENGAQGEVKGHLGEGSGEVFGDDKTVEANDINSDLEAKLSIENDGSDGDSGDENCKSNNNDDQEEKIENLGVIAENDELHDDANQSVCVPTSSSQPIFRPGCMTSGSDMDALIHTALLRCLKYIYKDASLPVLISTFWATVLRCVVEDEPQLDLKKSSFRKVSDLINHYCRIGLIQISEDGGVQYLSSVVRQNDIWKHTKLNVQDADNFRLFVRGDIEGSYSNIHQESAIGAASCRNTESYNIFEANEGNDKNGLNSFNLGNKKLDGNNKYQVIDLMKVPRNFLSDILWGKEGEFGLCLRASEVKQLLFAYVQESSFECRSNKSCVELPAAQADSQLYRLCAKLPSQRDNLNPTIKSVLKPAIHVKSNHASVVSFTDSARVHFEEKAGENFDDESIMLDTEGGIGGSVGDVDGVLLPSVQSIIQQASINRSQAFGNTSTANQSSNEILEKTVWRTPVSLTTTKIPVSHAKSQFLKAAGDLNSAKINPTGRIQSSVSKSNSLTHPAKDDEAAHESLIVRKEDLLKAVLAKLTPYHAIVSPQGEVTIATGTPSNIVVTMEARVGNKVVTRIQGLENFNLDLHQAVKDCQKRFACSVSLADLVGSKDRGKEVVIQGNFASELETMLISGYGIPRHLIEIKSSKDVKPKKK